MSAEITRFFSGRTLRLFIVCLVSAAVIAGLAAYEYFVLGLEPHDESAPRFGVYFLIRSALVIGCSLLLTATVWASRRPLGAVRLDAISTLAIYGSAVCSIVAAFTFLWNSEAFHRYALEDGLVEWTSAGACFLASITFLITAFRRYARGSSRSGLVCVGLALLTFLIGMEEISWMQRVLVFESPEMFAHNRKNEVNLHNFFTNVSENLYYVGSFAILIAVPFLNEAYGIAIESHPLADVVPDRPVALVAAPLVAFNYDMWNIIPIQMAFFMTLVLLLAYLWDMTRRKDTGIYAVLAVACAVVIVQGVFLGFGENLVRSWEPTEYKELLIPLAFFFYAFRVATKTFSA